METINLYRHEEEFDLEKLEAVLKRDEKLERLMFELETYKKILPENQEMEISFEKGTLNIKFHNKS